MRETPVVPDVNDPLPTFFISHGGGPSFLMDIGESSSTFDRAMRLMDKNSHTCKALRTLVETQLGGVRPRAVVVVSAHHEAHGGHEVTPRGDAEPGLYYDYGGFPREFYNLSFSPRGSSAVASEVITALKSAGVPIAGESGQAPRGYDHGVYMPLMQMFPDPPPIVQVSLDSSMDAAAHMRLGAALAPLRRHGILLVGSGHLVHNLRHLMFTQTSDEPPSWYTPFARWVTEVLGGGGSDSSAREARAQEFKEWRKNPWSKGAHPTEDHFLPLHVMATAGSGRADSVSRATIVTLEKEPSSGYLSGIVRFD